MKVLLVRTDSQLGDTIFETCFYREIKRHFSDAHITVMVCGNRRVLENLPYIDEFIWLPSRGIKGLKTRIHKIMGFFLRDKDENKSTLRLMFAALAVGFGVK